MKDKNHLAKLALAGLLVAANLPAGAQADVLDSKVTYLAVAGCAGHGCKGQTGPDKANSDNQDSTNKNENNKSKSTVGNPASNS